MKLKKLLQGVKFTSTTVSMETEISDICYDSRMVKTGDLFVAIRGYATDGHKFISKALEQGAVAVLCEAAPEGVPAIVVTNARQALAEIAANRFEHPAKQLTMIGVTGTNGKTTTTYLIKHILEAQGHRVGLIGTNQNLIGERVIETERTTPESYELHALLREMVEAGCTHVVMEVSSHSLVLDRVRGISFAVGAFTNLTQDHLDFHKTMEEYRRAKAKLLIMSDKGVVNLDDPAAGQMLEDAACPVLTYSARSDNACFSAKNIRLHKDSVDFICAAEGSLARVHLDIPGMFSVQNALCALGCAVSLGMSLECAADALRTAQGVKGRAEVVPVPEGTPYTVLIDYAHSPDGIENILRAVREFTKGRVVAIFGCGGDRDRTKRPKMGALAARFADLCIVTSDNPRTENPEAIIADIIEGMTGFKTPKEIIVDRRAAIVWALDHAKKGDTLIFMGKGHETYQEIHHIKHHLDEREEIVKYFAEKAK